jgi:hypothetical protein
MYPVPKVVFHTSGRDYEEDYRARKKRFNLAIAGQAEDLGFAEDIFLLSHEFFHKAKELTKRRKNSRIAE